MPLVEVLPHSGTTYNAPGWAYVPDTGYDPSKAPLQPASNRQRAARRAGGPAGGVAGHERSVRQNNAILKRLADLDRDNHREVQIAIPAKHRDGGARASRTKIPSNVRRILASQKTFANHLADETAVIANANANQNQNANNQSQAPAAQLHRASTTKDETEDPTDASSSGHGHPRRPAIDEDENHPLLKSYVPIIPPQAVLDDLLSAPPLLYAAARAPPSPLGHPPRYFCEICGYWGRARCLKCGARVCGLECQGVHDDGRCLKFYNG